MHRAEMKALKNISVAFLAIEPSQNGVNARSRGVRESVQTEDCLSLSLSRLKHSRIRRCPQEYARG